MSGSEQPSLWILTDGKAGDEQPLIGVADAIGSTPVVRRVRPRPLFSLFMPNGPIDPRERPGQLNSPLAPPFPDICMASGRRAVAYLRALKRYSPSTFTVFFRDPRTRRHGADLLVVQAHDELDGDAVFVTTTAPNRMLPSLLEQLRDEVGDGLNDLPHPRVAVLIGGDSRHHRFRPSDVADLVQALAAVVADGSSLLVTTSRRTPPHLSAAIADLGQNANVIVWNGSGSSPLARYLALADEVIVTADSTNMIGEAAATGRPIRVFHPSGGHPKIDRFLAALSQQASLGRFPGPVPTKTYAPVNSTHAIASEIMRRYELTRR